MLRILGKLSEVNSIVIFRVVSVQTMPQTLRPVLILTLCAGLLSKTIPTLLDN